MGFDAKAFDPEAVNALASMCASDGAADFLQEILDTFKQSSSDAMVDFKKAVEARDPRALKAVAHKLKSSCRLVGFTGLADICEKIEIAPDAVVFTHARDDVKTMQNHLPALLAMLQDFIGQSSRRAV